MHMSDLLPSRPTPSYRRLHQDGNHSPAPGTKPATPPFEAQPQLSLSPEMQQAQEVYRQTALTHPDALGGVLGQLVAQRTANDFCMDQLLKKYLAQPGLELRDLEEVLPIVDRMNAGSKLTLALSLLEWETRKMHMTNPDPMLRRMYNSKLQKGPDKSPVKYEADAAAALQMIDQLMPKPSAKPPAKSPAEPPATLPLSAASEKSQN
jgi:hypothetical protein